MKCMGSSLPQQVLVTGAAGFIGSHLTDRLLDLGGEVFGFDNLSSGDKADLTHAMVSPRFQFVEGGLLDSDATKCVLGQCPLIFHLAADPEVRTGAESPDSHFKQNLLTTFNLLDAIRMRGTPTKFVQELSLRELAWLCVIEIPSTFAGPGLSGLEEDALAFPVLLQRFLQRGFLFSGHLFSEGFFYRLESLPD